MSSVTAAAPGARREGFLVSEMLSDGVECIIGVVQDPSFDAVVMFGLGGIAVEVFGDVTFRLAPVDAAEARRMVEGTRGDELLIGHRGRKPSDVPAPIEAIVAPSRAGFANAAAVSSIELNPLLVMPRGHGVIALDAAIDGSTDRTMQDAREADGNFKFFRIDIDRDGIALVTFEPPPASSATSG
jgi:hypothetical protein